MSQPRYQIHHEVYNFDRTKLTKYIKPKLYHDVNISNHDAEKLLHDLSGDGEVLRVIETKEYGMQVQETVEEEKQQNGETASEGDAVEAVEKN